MLVLEPEPNVYNWVVAQTLIHRFFENQGHGLKKKVKPLVSQGAYPLNK